MTTWNRRGLGAGTALGNAGRQLSLPLPVQALVTLHWVDPRKRPSQRPHVAGSVARDNVQHVRPQADAIQRDHGPEAGDTLHAQVLPLDLHIGPGPAGEGLHHEHTVEIEFDGRHATLGVSPAENHGARGALPRVEPRTIELDADPVRAHLRHR